MASGTTNIYIPAAGREENNQIKQFALFGVNKVSGSRRILAPAEFSDDESSIPQQFIVVLNFSILRILQVLMHGVRIMDLPLERVNMKIALLGTWSLLFLKE